MISGIYCIENLINGKKYIGQTSDFFKRESDHFTALRNNRHKSTHLQNAFNEYKENNFIFKIILYCEKEYLTYYEQKCVDIFQSEYNIRKKCINSNLGMIHSEEAKKRISKSKTGKRYSKEQKERKKLETYNTGRFKKGKEHPLYGKKGKDSPTFGRHRTENEKKKISDALKGKPGHHLGIPQTEECKNKISEFWRKKREEKENTIISPSSKYETLYKSQ